jgi:hypothetical protein
MEEYKELIKTGNIKMDQLVDIKDIKMDENLNRKQRIDRLKEISYNGYVKYDNVLIKLDFVSVYPDDYLEQVNEV